MLKGSRHSLAFALAISGIALLPAWDAILALNPAIAGLAPVGWLLGATAAIMLPIIICAATRRSRAFWVAISGLVLAPLLFETAAFLYINSKNELAVYANEHYWLVRNAIGALAGACTLGICVWIWRAGIAAVVVALANIVALLAPLPFVLTFAYAFPLAQSSKTHLHHKAQRVVVVLIFDELDAEMLQADINLLPNFHALRRTALAAASVFPPANYTSESLPGILTGTQFVDASYSRKEIHVLPSDRRHWLPLSKQETLFSDVAAAGGRVTLIGWHLPYCDVFTSVDHCWDDAVYRAPGSSVSLPEWLLGHSRLYGALYDRFLNGMQFNLAKYSLAFLNAPSNYRLRRIGEIFDKQSEELLATLSAQRSELVFAHVACPHPPALAASEVGRLDMYSAYTANLPYCDRLLGNVLAVLGSRDLYREGSVLIVTSDHWFRWSDWKDAGRPLIMPRGRRSVPFYLQIGTVDGSTYSTDKSSNLRFMRALVRGAYDKDFAYAVARRIVEAQADGPTVLRPF